MFVFLTTVLQWLLWTTSEWEFGMFFFFLLCFGSSEERWRNVLEGCVSWFCSLTNEIEVGAALSSQGAGL